MTFGSGVMSGPTISKGWYELLYRSDKAQAHLREVKQKTFWRFLAAAVMGLMVLAYLPVGPRRGHARFLILSLG